MFFPENICASATCSLNLFPVIINQREVQSRESSSKPKTPRRNCLVSKNAKQKSLTVLFDRFFFSFPSPLSPQIPSAGLLMDAMLVKMKEGKVLTEELAALQAAVSKNA